MLSPKSTIEGDFNFTARPLDEAEKKYYGIFISHSNSDNEKHLFPLLDAMRRERLHPLCDRDILSGGDDYQKIIESYLDCYAGVVIISEASLRSNWVNYEIGIFAGHGLPVFLYDPEDVLSRTDLSIVSDLYCSHIGRYLPAYKNTDDLIVALRGLSPYADMCLEENSFITKSSFLDRVSEHVETIILRIESPVFDEYADLLSASKICTIVTNFGMFYPDHGDGEHCYAQRFRPLEDGKCPLSCRGCALVSPMRVTEENKECVILNHTFHNGKILRTGEADVRGEVNEVSSLVFHVPLHKIYGTEFKIFIDVPSEQVGEKLIEMFLSIGMIANMSDNVGSKRLYVSMPERRAQGMFRLEHEFQNNFLCPKAGKAKV